MGRPSNRAEKRAQIVEAFARVLADHGYAGATISKLAFEAGVAPGLVHHHFDSKQELLGCLLDMLMGRFRARVAMMQGTSPSPLNDYADAALKLDERADSIAAKCWVGLFAEAVKNPDLFRRVRRSLDAEIDTIVKLSRGKLDDHGASAVMAFVVGALVFGALAPRKTAGFAAPALRQFVSCLELRRGG